MSRLLCALSALVTAATMTTAATQDAHACGMPLEAVIPNERALVVHQDGREEIIAQLGLRASEDATESPAVVFPVPAEAEVDALPDAAVFDYLEDVTKPEVRIVEIDSDDEGAGGAPPTGGVDVISRDRIGDYDVVQLDADDTPALTRYLDGEGFTIPDGAEPILDQYLTEGWRFIAVRLAEGASPQGALSPLRIAFPSEQIVYPMRLDQLSEEPITIDLYVNSDHRVTAERLVEQYAGPAAAFDKPVPAELKDVLRAPYLTKLQGVRLEPTLIETDLVATRAPDDRPFRAVRNEYRAAEGGTPWAAIGGIAGAVLLIAAVGGIFLVKRSATRPGP